MRPVVVLSLLLCCTALCLGCSTARAQDEPAAPEPATVTVPAAEWEALKARLEALEKEVQALKAAAPAEAPPAAEVVPPPAPEPAPAPTTGGRYLALPDISLIALMKGHLSSDERDEGRDSLRVSEVELGVQGWVYPNVKADAFLTASPEEEAPFGVEEAYLTYVGLGSGLNLYAGKKQVAFGRTNLVHSHSWPYVNQPLVLRDLVAEESLLGEGAAASYLLPTNSGLFAQLDVGTWTASAGHSHEHEEEGEDGEHEHVVRGTGAGFNRRFNTARLWASYPATEQSEVEIGGSYAEGPVEMASVPGEGRARLTGADLSYRHYGEGNRRLLLRGEAFRRREESDLGASAAKGYYLFGSYRTDKYNSLGLLYDWSEFPQAPGLHESALSLILTRQFSEQYYLRLQGVRGSRPGADPYSELWLEWVWGVGPHTHNLE